MKLWNSEYERDRLINEFNFLKETLPPTDFSRVEAFLRKILCTISFEPKFFLFSYMFPFVLFIILNSMTRLMLFCFSLFVEIYLFFHKKKINSINFLYLLKLK